MAPIRRYLRITKNSVLEVRIYLDKPSDAPWLLSERDPVLQRIMTAIRPKVLPKLREENENAKKKTGKKKKNIKDVVTREDFEVIIFLKDLSTRHSLLTKQKHFDINKPRLKTTGSKLTSWLNTADTAIPVDDDDDEGGPEILRENDDEVVELHDIPDVGTKSKRKASDDVEDGLFVNSSDDEAFEPPPERPAKQRKRLTDRVNTDPDDKKKMALNTAYEGFSIYGRTLCLVVKRKGSNAAPQTTSAPLGGSQMMEQWVSTQAAQEGGLDFDDD